MAVLKKKKKDIIEKQFIFTEESVKEVIDKMSQGYSIPRYMNPWFKNEPGVRRRGCTYGWTQEEIDEYTKCALDIHYFANTYCHIKSEDSKVKQMKLRDYQYKVLDAYSKNRFTINMSSRQTGKCKDLITNVLVKENGIIKLLPAFKILFKYKESKSIYDYIKYPIYWILWKIN